MSIIRTKNKIYQHACGFTLLEILISLFIFTILAMISTSALHTVINAQAGTEKNSARLRELQTALLIMSREIKQTIDRPIINSIGKEEVAFKGTPRGFIFTHLGFENPIVSIAKSSLERSGYYWDKGKLWREVWPTLDQAPKAKAYSRPLLHNVTNARFEYLDGEGRFHQQWPLESATNLTLPRAIKVELEIARWGKLSQIYVIFADPVKTQAATSPPQSAQSPTPKAEESKADADEQSPDDKQSPAENGDEQSPDDKQTPPEDGDEQSPDDKQPPPDTDEQSPDDRQPPDNKQPPAPDSDHPSDDEESPP